MASGSRGSLQALRSRWWLPLRSQRKQVQLLLVFATLGVAASLFPAAIPSMSSALALEPNELIAAVPAMFGGILVAVAATTTLAKRVLEQHLIRLAMLLISLGLGSAALVPQAYVFIGAAFVVGLGFGLAEVVATSAAKRLKVETSTALTQLNAVFAIAALGAPLMYVAVSTFSTATTGFLIAGLASLLIAFWFRSDQSAEQTVGQSQKLNPSLLLFALAALCYVGAETLIAGWSSVIVNEIGGVQADFAAIGGSLFWALFALGRIISTALTPMIMAAQSALVMWGGISTVSLVTAGVFWDGGTLVLIAFAFAATAAGPCYALIIGLALDQPGVTNSTTLTSALVLFGALGGFLLPLLAQAIGGFQTVAVMSALGFGACLVFILMAQAFSSKQQSMEVA